MHDMAEPKELGTLIVVVGKAVSPVYWERLVVLPSCSGVLRAHTQRNLVNKSRFGKQDPFCTVTYGEDKQKTKAIKRYVMRISPRCFSSDALPNLPCTSGWVTAGAHGQRRTTS